MKDLLVITLVCGLACVGMLAWHNADADELQPIGLIQVKEPTTFDVVQQLYDQAISELVDGSRDKGCRILHKAFAHSTGLNDNWKAYNQIWEIGTRACNWTLRPDTVEASAIN